MKPAIDKEFLWDNAIVFNSYADDNRDVYWCWSTVKNVVKTQNESRIFIGATTTDTTGDIVLFDGVLSKCDGKTFKNPKEWEALSNTEKLNNWTLRKGIDKILIYKKGMTPPILTANPMTESAMLSLQKQTDGINIITSISVFEEALEEKVIQVGL